MPPITIWFWVNLMTDLVFTGVSFGHPIGSKRRRITNIVGGIMYIPFFVAGSLSQKLILAAVAVACTVVLKKADKRAEREE